MCERNYELDRRDFMKKGAQATAAAAVLSTSNARAAEPVQLPLFLVRGVCAKGSPSSSTTEAISNKETR